MRKVFIAFFFFCHRLCAQVDDMSYTIYEPRKLKLGVPHPDPVVENASMAAVDPPELWYRLKLQVHKIAYFGKKKRK